jgi:uncharacterized membrane protein
MTLRFPPSRAWIPRLIATALVLFAACGSGDRPLDQIDPDSVPDPPAYEQVFAIIDRECVPCHSGDDGPPDFSTCTAVVAERDKIWERIDNNTMPPGAWPRLSSEERLTIRRWIDDGAPAPCNPVTVLRRGVGR